MDNTPNRKLLQLIGRYNRSKNKYKKTLIIKEIMKEEAKTIKK